MNTDKQTNSVNTPSHIAYKISKGGEKSYWTRIGIAFAHKDEKGFSLLLESLPIDGKITLRIAEEKE
jgi:hypothetical protein